MPATVPRDAPRISRTEWEHRFFSASAILFLVPAVVGFTASGIVRSRAGDDLGTARLLVHGVAGFLWLDFYVVQTRLVARGRVSTHRALGTLGVVLYVFMLAATLYLSFTSPGAHPERPIELIGRGVGTLLINLAFVTPLFVLALHWRGAPTPTSARCSS